MKKKVKVFVALLMVMTLTLGITSTAFACTPQYKPLSEYGYTGVPNVEVELSDDVKLAIDKSVSNYIEKCKLSKPVVTSATSWKQKTLKRTYTSLVVTWDKIGDATYYKVEVSNPDGTSKTYNVNYNLFSLNSYKDEFISNLTSESTVRVRAYGEDDTFSPWSDKSKFKCLKSQ